MFSNIEHKFDNLITTTMSEILIDNPAELKSPFSLSIIIKLNLLNVCNLIKVLPTHLHNCI
jgi:hypothetical protein